MCISQALIGVIIVISPTPIVKPLKQKFVLMSTLFDGGLVQEPPLIRMFINEQCFCHTQPTLSPDQTATDLLQDRPLDRKCFLVILKLPRILSQFASLRISPMIKSFFMYTKPILKRC